MKYSISYTTQTGLNWVAHSQIPVRNDYEMTMKYSISSVKYSISSVKWRGVHELAHLVNSLQKHTRHTIQSEYTKAE